MISFGCIIRAEDWGTRHKKYVQVLNVVDGVCSFELDFGTIEKVDVTILDGTSSARLACGPRYSYDCATYLPRIEPWFIHFILLYLCLDLLCTINFLRFFCGFPTFIQLSFLADFHFVLIRSGKGVSILVLFMSGHLAAGGRHFVLVVVQC